MGQQLGALVPPSLAELGPNLQNANIHINKLSDRPGWHLRVSAECTVLDPQTSPPERSSERSKERVREQKNERVHGAAPAFQTTPAPILEQAPTLTSAPAPAPAPIAATTPAALMPALLSAADHLFPYRCMSSKALLDIWATALADATATALSSTVPVAHWKDRWLQCLPPDLASGKDKRARVRAWIQSAVWAETIFASSFAPLSISISAPTLESVTSATPASPTMPVSTSDTASPAVISVSADARVLPAPSLMPAPAPSPMPAPTPSPMPAPAPVTNELPLSWSNGLQKRLRDQANPTALQADAYLSRDYYVYMYLRSKPATPCTWTDLAPRILYIGKGRGDRVWQHAIEADAANDSPNCDHKTSDKVREIRALWAIIGVSASASTSASASASTSASTGAGPIACRLFGDMGDKEAYSMEDLLVRWAAANGAQLTNLAETSDHGFRADPDSSIHYAAAAHCWSRIIAALDAAPLAHIGRIARLAL
jgi:hypothetical protein